MALTPEEKQHYIVKRAAGDIHLRARVGPIFYILSFVLSASNDNMFQLFFSQTVFIFILFCVLAAIRLSLPAPPESYSGIDFWRKKTLTTIYISCFSWGLCLAWVLDHPELPNVLQMMLICTFAISTATAHQFSIERIHGKLASITFFIPALLIIFIYHPDQVILAYAFLAYSLYLLLTGIRGNKEYVSILETEIGLIEAQQNLKDLSLTDELTKLANRRHYRTFLDDAFNLALKKDQGLFLILLDLDFFKKINDTHGHLIGDICLQRTAETLRNHFKRDEDLIARIGGEEFAIILQNTTLSYVAKLTETVQAEIAKVAVINNETTINFTASFGVACYNASYDIQPNDIVKRADDLLFRAKETGRNKIEYEK
ncbi:MAG: GGDEF domain-containing protein [Thalassotalea sp.]